MRRGTHLALSDRRPGVAPQLDRRPALAETVGGLTGVVGEVLLPNLGDGQSVPSSLLTRHVASLEVQPHVVLVPDHLRRGLGVDKAEEGGLVARPALHQVVDRVNVRSVEHVEVDLVSGGLPDTIGGPAEIETAGRPCDGVEGKDRPLVVEAVLDRVDVPHLPGPAPLHTGPGVPVHFTLQADAGPAPHHDLPVRRLRLDSGRH